MPQPQSPHRMRAVPEEPPRGLDVARERGCRYVSRGAVRREVRPGAGRALPEKNACSAGCSEPSTVTSASIGGALRESCAGYGGPGPAAHTAAAMPRTRPGTQCPEPTSPRPRDAGNTHIARHPQPTEHTPTRPRHTANVRQSKSTALNTGRNAKIKSASRAPDRRKAPSAPRQRAHKANPCACDSAAAPAGSRPDRHRAASNQQPRARNRRPGAEGGASRSPA